MRAARRAVGRRRHFLLSALISLRKRCMRTEFRGGACLVTSLGGVGPSLLENVMCRVGLLCFNPSLGSNTRQENGECGKSHRHANFVSARITSAQFVLVR